MTDTEHADTEHAGTALSGTAPSGTRVQFLETATHLFAARGFYGVSLAAIAAEMGLTKQALLHHFGTKEKLYGEVLAGISDAFGGAVTTAQAHAETPAGQLEAVVLEIYRRAVAHPDETQLLMRELLDNKRRVEQAGAWYLKPFLDGLVAIARQTDRWRSAGDAAALAGIYQLLGAVNYFAVSEPTLTRMFGEKAFAALRTAYPAELARLVRASINQH